MAAPGERVTGGRAGWGDTAGRLADASRLSALAARLAARAGRVSILMYHSVADRPAGATLRTCLDLIGMGVSVATFEQQMRVLAQHYDVVPLAEYIASRGRAPLGRKPAAAITFDDGFADNLENAVPVLERHGLPATFFLIGDCLAQARVPPIYTLYALLDALDHATLTVSTRTARLEGVVLDSDRAKTTVIRALRAVAQQGPEDERVMLFDQLADIAVRLGRAPAGIAARFLDAAGARALVARGFDIGGHSMTHARLTAVSPAAQREEIRGSADMVRALQGDRMLAFAYPFGSAGSYSEGTRRCLVEAGFTCAVTTRSGLCGPREDVFELRRLEIGEFGKARFKAAVSGVLSFPKASVRGIRDRLRKPQPAAEAS